MSGNPHKQGITDAIELVRKLWSIEGSQRELDELIQKHRDGLERKAALASELTDLLRGMDLESTGNFGWETRLIGAIAEVMRQLDTEHKNDYKLHHADGKVIT